MRLVIHTKSRGTAALLRAVRSGSPVTLTARPTRSALRSASGGILLGASFMGDAFGWRQRRGLA